MVDVYDPDSEEELAMYLYTNYGVDSLREMLKQPSPTLIETWNLSEEQYIEQIKKAIAKILVD